MLVLRVVLKKPWLAYLVLLGVMLSFTALSPVPWPGKAVPMLLFAAIAVYGFVISLGGQLKFTDDVFD